MKKMKILKYRENLKLNKRHVKVLKKWYPNSSMDTYRDGNR